ncbi:MAG TPA: MFS transporter [Puia sp.]|jgi:EmrB/QacA subfamily drug resistance transporter|nr:MFS transporter [Puia sp.]
MSTVSIRSPAGEWVMASTILASAMAFIDSTALNVVLPALQKNLHATGADLFWILNAYLLMLASLILVGGSLGDRLGRKKIFMAGIFIFICGSAACGIAPTTGWLILFRVVQGVGGALMIPGSLSLLSSSIDETEKGKAIGTWSAVTTMVTMGGPILGGALADAGLWRYIFFINVPIGIAALLILRSKVEESRDMTSVPGPDLAGAATIALGLAALTFGFLRMPDLGFRHWSVPGSLSAGVVLLLAFTGIERRSKHPMMPLSLFANPVFTGVNCLTFFLYAGLSAGMLFLSLNLVQTQGYSQLESGMTFLPFTLLMISLARHAGTLSDRHGPRLFLTLGPAAAGAGLLLLSFVGQTRGPADFWTSFLPGILVLGLGMAFTVAPLTTTVMRSVSNLHSGVASGINNAMTRISNVFANAIFGALAVLLFTGILQQRLDGMMLPAGVKQAAIAQAADLGNAHVPDSVPEAQRPAIAAAYRAGFISVYRKMMRLAAGVAFAGAFTGWVFIRHGASTTIVQS